MLHGIGLDLRRQPRDPYPGATPALDFARKVYKVPGMRASDIGAVPGWTYTRTGTEDAATRAGLLVPFAANVPAITDLGLQVWQAEENLQTYDSDTSHWSTQNVTFDPGKLAPDSTLTATDLSNTPGANSFASAPATTLANSTTYTRAILAKAITGTGVLALEINTGVGTLNATFNLNAGTFTVSAGASARMTPLIDGWYRCEFTFTTAATGTPLARVCYVGAYGNTLTPTTVRVCKAKVVLGALNGPDIPTTGAAATRGAAVASFNPPADVSKGTIFYEGIWGPGGANMTLLEGANVVGMTMAADGSGVHPRILQRHGTARGDFSAGPLLAVGQAVKMALAWDAAGCAAAVNGVALTNVATPIQADWGAAAAVIGCRLQAATPTAYADTVHRRVLWYSTKYTQAQLQALTT